MYLHFRDVAKAVDFGDNHVDKGVSGKTIERPALRKLIVDVKAGKLTTIITFELSHLSRNFLDTLFVMQTITAAGVEVECPGDGVVQFENTLEQFMVAACSLSSAQERERISERTKAGLMVARARGVKLGAKSGWTRKLGWRKDYHATEPQLIEKIVSKRQRGRSYAENAGDLGISVNKRFRIAKRIAMQHQQGRIVNSAKGN
jgi:DNA invertase Pin-like site-specific DNA recombinase